MEAYIEITYNAAIKEAEKLEACADNMEKSKTKLAHASETLASAWSSEGAVKYRSACTKLQEELSYNAAYIRKVAKALRKTAKVYKEAEMKKAGNGSSGSW